MISALIPTRRSSLPLADRCRHSRRLEFLDIANMMQKPRDMRELSSAINMRSPRQMVCGQYWQVIPEIRGKVSPTNCCFYYSVAISDKYPQPSRGSLYILHSTSSKYWISSTSFPAHHRQELLALMPIYLKLMVKTSILKENIHQHHERSDRREQYFRCWE